jgi:ribonuclease HI
LNRRVIEIYTDGSCHTQCKIGGWAAILFLDGQKIILQGVDQNTTHNRMELLAVIKAIEFTEENYKDASLKVYTDSQYVFRIPERMEKLKRTDFITKKGKALQNQDLLEILISGIETLSIEFVKVKAHQHSDSSNFNSPENYNSEVDKLARQIVREAVNSSIH